MPSNYNGDGSAITAHGAPTIACPVDGDARNAASANTPTKKLADFIAYLQSYAALFGASRPNADVLVVNGQAGDGNPVLETTAAPTAYKLLWRADANNGGRKIRVYATLTGLVVTYNLALTSSTQGQADVAAACFYLRLGSGFDYFAYTPGNTSPFNLSLMRAISFTAAQGLEVPFTDTGTGNATANTMRGRSGIAAGQNTITITNSLCRVGYNTVLAQLEGASFDATLTRIVVNPGDGQFQIIGNAAATVGAQVGWVVVGV